MGLPARFGEMGLTECMLPLIQPLKNGEQFVCLRLHLRVVAVDIARLYEIQHI